MEKKVRNVPAMREPAYVKVPRARISHAKLISSRRRGHTFKGDKVPLLQIMAVKSQRPRFKSWIHQVLTVLFRAVSFISFCFIFPSVTWEDEM